jgi:uncharacterized membrane protein YcaP (DUF421 family)
MLFTLFNLEQMAYFSIELNGKIGVLMESIYQTVRRNKKRLTHYYNN